MVQSHHNRLLFNSRNMVKASVDPFFTRRTHKNIYMQLIKHFIIFHQKLRLMYSQSENFRVVDFQIHFTQAQENPKFDFEPTPFTMELNSQIFIDQESPFCVRFGEESTANNQEEDESEEEIANQADSAPQKKKRNTQNSIRTILRVLKPHLSQFWDIGIPKFFQKQKQLYLLAVFRKEWASGRLERLKEILTESTKGLLQKQFETNGKDKKLQLYLKFFLSLTEEKLHEKNIDKTIKQLGEAGKFKKHPLKWTRVELQETQAKFQTK